MGDAYLVRDRGRKARAAGKTHLDNPWPVGTEKHLWWFQGWSWGDVRPPDARS